MTGGGSKEFFLLHPPNENPKLPKHWSWSALAAWRLCPKRWWLSRAGYDNAPTPYPQRIVPAVVEGILLHGAMERFTDHVDKERAKGISDYADIRSTFPVRRIMQQRLKALLLNSEMPRVDAKQVSARVSIDECVNAFRSAAASYFDGVRSGSVPSTSTIGGNYGAEVWLSVDQPRICGRADYMRSGRILDFKTGEPKSADRDQVVFYALLVWLGSGKVPAELSLAYLRENREEAVAVPSVPELEKLAAEIGQEIEEAERRIGEGNVEAKPSAENCRMCEVRQLCTEFWRASETETLRLCSATPVVDSHQWCDVELTTLPPRTVSQTFVGESTVSRNGSADVRIEQRHVIPGRSVTAARLLNARVHRQGGHWQVLAGAGSEVFWFEALPPTSAGGAKQG